MYRANSAFLEKHETVDIEQEKTGRSTSKKTKTSKFSKGTIYYNDNCGGICGFLRMLRTINGEDKDEAREVKAWARSLGWAGRIYKPVNML